MKFNLCLSKKYQSFIFFAIGAFFMAFIMAAMPWVAGPYWVNVVGNFFATLLIYGVWVWVVKFPKIWSEWRNK